MEYKMIMDAFVWLLYHNQQIGWICLLFIIYKILNEREIIK